ncbi:ParB/RepB/Spo0J family partition protein [Thermicanus aegyptius]|uniref:ParB/RepB/Spo0J family partition protein n=1 Tax=Thermicanus aegyptius TaxID=94009 RepID=UPI000402E666|nr:ParB/RepB/Spo0J family partition protein [Thermicanus aegyptius]
MAKRLGRGLDSLIPGLEIDGGDLVKDIPIEQLRPNPYQPRKEFNQESLEELKESIIAHGVIQPILVRKSLKGYDIIAGERRYRAAQLAGLKTIPAVERKFNEEQMMEIALIENLQREDLNPIEIAEAYHTIMERFQLTQEELAKRMGKSRPLVANFLRLLNLPEEIKEHVSRGTISMGHAKILVAIGDPHLQMELVRETINKGLSVRDLEQRVQELGSGKKKTRKEVKRREDDLYYKGVEERLREHFGTPVSIRPGKKKGKIEIIFLTIHDLERILDKIENR